MEFEINVTTEHERGCGFRHSGPDGVGLYLMGEGFFESCERLPFPLNLCPTCGAGIKFSRAFTWIEPQTIFEPFHTNPRCLPDMPNHNHGLCFMCNPMKGKHGLMWVGEKFYDPDTFTAEARRMGISKRIASLPQGFEFGKTIVYLAHKKAIKIDVSCYEDKEPMFTYQAAVFMVFKPTRLELVVDVTDPDELPEKAKNLAKRHGSNARIVKVERAGTQAEFAMEGGAE